MVCFCCFTDEPSKYQNNVIFVHGEGSNKILDVFLLRFGAVVLDHDAPFCLRLEVGYCVSIILTDIVSL